MSPVRLEVIETSQHRPVTRLHQLVRQRDSLRASFRDVWKRLEAGQSDRDLDVWAEAVLELAYVNAGPACLLACWRTSIDLKEALGLAAVAALAHAAADVCRYAGADATLAYLHTAAPAQRTLGTPHELALWTRGLRRLAREAPESVIAVTSRTETILRSCDGAAFEAFIAAGLKAAGRDRARRRAFFTLEDPAARQVLDGVGRAQTFSAAERSLKLFATALWGRAPVLRAAVPQSDQRAPRRISLAGGVVRVPQIFRDVPADAAGSIFRAGIAHASAHLALSPLFHVGSLKPQQIVLVGLIEDARVETIAMRRFPGLRRLWAPFHVAEPAGAITAPALLARLARALFDRNYQDDNGFIAKARALFEAEMTAPEDSGLSRRIGDVLGNDLGQMRVQFDARGHVIEPAYRDDGLGLWDLAAQGEAAPGAIDVVVDAVRVEHTDEPVGADLQRPDAGRDDTAVGRARSVADAEGLVVATYPEWDRTAGIERPDWVTVRERAPDAGDPREVERALEQMPAVRARTHRLVRTTRIGRHQRRRREPDGPDLDFEAALEAAIAMRAGAAADARIYRTMARQTRDLAALILVDVSESTRDRAGNMASILEVERAAVAALCEALCRLGDPFALRAFASRGREHVFITRIKDFDEPYGASCMARLAGLAPGLSTRLGAALRHAGAEIAAVRSHRKLVLVLSDGEPSDIDVTDPIDLIEDARRAVLRLQTAGIDVFGVTLDPADAGAGTAVFGPGHNMPVRRLSDLPARLSDLYFRLSRR
jgi:nitric oxide reductase NorD protein